jgi:hypothetical protein
MQVAFRISNVYDYITKLCSIHARVILHHINPNVHGVGKGDTNAYECKKFKLGSGQANDCSAN